MITNGKGLNKIQLCQYHCEHCGHVMFFTVGEKKKLCNQCNRYTRPIGLSVGEENLKKKIKRTYKDFLERRKVENEG